MCPRTVLRQQLQELKGLGYQLRIGWELEARLGVLLAVRIHVPS